MIDENNRVLLGLVGKLFERPVEIEKSLQTYFQYSGDVPSAKFYRKLLEYTGHWLSIQPQGFAEKNDEKIKAVKNYCEKKLVDIEGKSILPKIKPFVVPPIEEYKNQQNPQLNKSGPNTVFYMVLAALAVLIIILLLIKWIK